MKLLPPWVSGCTFILAVSGYASFVLHEDMLEGSMCGFEPFAPNGTTWQLFRGARSGIYGLYGLFPTLLRRDDLVELSI